MPVAAVQGLGAPPNTEKSPSLVDKLLYPSSQSADAVRSKSWFCASSQTQKAPRRVIPCIRVHTPLSTNCWTRQIHIDRKEIGGGQGLGVLEGNGM